MTITAVRHWSAISAIDVDVDRRTMLILSAGAAAALLTAGKAALQQLPPADAARDILLGLSKDRWGWNVELAVLQRLDTDRRLALDLLWAALELDLDPMQHWHRKPALRLYDLYAAASDTEGRAALAALVRARSRDPVLLSRATNWSDPARTRRSPLWRTAGPGRRNLGIYVAPA